MIKVTASALVLYTMIVCLVLWYFRSSASALSCALGGAIMLLNLLGFYYIWRLVFQNRSVALTSLIIVLKYTFLGILIWKLGSLGWIEPIGFVLGLSSLVIAILSMTAYQSFVRKNS